MTKPTITAQLRQAAIASGLTAYALAKATGIPISRMQEFLAGGGMRSGNMDRLAEFLGLALKRQTPPRSGGVIT